MSQTIRAVLDANLLVSYLLTGGETLSHIMQHWERGAFIYLISPSMEAELREVVKRPRLARRMSADPQALLDAIENDAEWIPGELLLIGVCRDPKDEIFISCAVEAGADYLVSGDADLLDMGSYGDVQMISPRAFLEIVDKVFPGA